MENGTPRSPRDPFLQQSFSARLTGTRRPFHIGSLGPTAGPVPPVFQPAARGRGRAWAFRGGTYVWAEGEASPWAQGAAGRGAGKEGRAREAEAGLAGEVQLGSEALPCSCPAVTSSSPPPRYRARVEKVESLAKVHVFYIDYGNVSWGGRRVFPPTPDNGQEVAPSTRSSCPGQRRLGGRRNGEGSRWGRSKRSSSCGRQPRLLQPGCPLPTDSPPPPELSQGREGALWAERDPGRVGQWKPLWPRRAPVGRKGRRGPGRLVTLDPRWAEPKGQRGLG